MLFGLRQIIMIIDGVPSTVTNHLLLLVVQIPPSAVLSYANVCGASASTVPAATGNAAVFQQSAQQRQRPLPLQQLQAHSTASGASTTVESSQHPALTGREPRSPPATVNERSGVEAEYATNDPSHSIRMTHGTDDAENTSITHYSAPRNMEAIMLSSADATASSLALSLALISLRQSLFCFFPSISF